MAINVSTLPEYVDENKLGLIAKTVYGAPSVKYLNIQTGIKHKAAINLLSTDPTLQAASCGWDENGDVDITQRELVVGNYKVNMSFCDKTLQEKWLNQEVIARAGAEVLPFEEKFTNDIVKAVGRKVENLIWNADSSVSSDPFDGLLTIAVADATPVTSAATTMYGKVKDVYLAIPVDVIDRAQIFMGVDSFRTLCQDLVTANLYHYQADMNSDRLELVLPGSNTKVVGVSGLNGTGAILAADPENLYYGVDMQDDEEAFEFWYSKDNREFRLAIGFNAGTQIAFPDQVVVYVPEP